MATRSYSEMCAIYIFDGPFFLLQAPSYFLLLRETQPSFMALVISGFFLVLTCIRRPFICFRYFWYFWYILPKVPLRSGTFGTFYHFVLLRTFFGEKIATFLRQVAAANAETTKSTAVERYFWYFLPKVPKLPKQMNDLKMWNSLLWIYLGKCPIESQSHVL